MANKPYKAAITTPPPAAQPVTQAAIYGPYGAFRNNGLLKAIIVTLLVCDAMLTIFIFAIPLLLSPEAQQQSAEKILQLLSIIGWIQLAARLSVAALFCLWINRCCKNGWLLDPPKMKTTPGLAVAYFFIPILALWKPFTTMKEIRNASYGRHDALNTILPLWWFFWLALCVIGTISMLQSGDSHAETLSITQKLSTVSGPLQVVFDYLIITLVVSITLAQQRRAAQWRP